MTISAFLLEELAEARLQAVVDHRFPLQGAAEAHANLQGRSALGRVLFLPA